MILENFLPQDVAYHVPKSRSVLIESSHHKVEQQVPLPRLKRRKNEMNVLTSNFPMKQFVSFECCPIDHLLLLLIRGARYRVTVTAVHLQHGTHPQSSPHTEKADGGLPVLPCQEEKMK